MKNLFKDVLQVGIVPVLCGSGSHPFNTWSIEGKGTVKVVMDKETQSAVVEVTSVLFCTTFISCPPNPMERMGIQMPCLTLRVKYLNLPFCFEFQVLDDRNNKRKFRLSNCQTKTKISTLLSHLPLTLEVGWNNVHIDLIEVMKRAYNSRYTEFLRMQIYANCQIRHIFFSDRWYSDDSLPKKYKLWMRIPPDAEKRTRLVA